MITETQAHQRRNTTNNKQHSSNHNGIANTTRTSYLTVHLVSNVTERDTATNDRENLSGGKTSGTQDSISTFSDHQGHGLYNTSHDYATV